jgi:hypothetical protein
MTTTDNTPQKSTWDPNLGPQIGPAWRAIADNLATRDWGSDQVAISIAMRTNGIQRKTARNLINDAVTHGLLERRPNGKHDQIRLTDRGRERRPVAS